MGKWVKSLLIIIFLILLLSPYARAESWEKVVNMGFGSTRNDYAWSMAKFKGKLYVGTLNTYGGAQIWCSDSGDSETWQRVGPRLSRNLGVRCLYADGNQALYVCMTSNFGAQILRSTDGKTWDKVTKNGFGNVKDYTIRCMVRFKSYLYAGVGCDGAKLYRSKNGLKWELINTNPSFTSTKVTNKNHFIPFTNNAMIGELAVFKDELYAFTWTKDSDPRSTFWSLSNLDVRENYQNLNEFFLFPTPGAFEGWRSKDGVNWEKVVGLDDPYGNGLGFSLHDPDNLNNDMVTSVAVFQGKLYLGTEHDFGKTSVWRTSEGTKWEKVLDFYKLGEEFNFYIWRLMPFDGQLFLSTANLGLAKNSKVTGAQIWVSHSGDVDTFYNLVHNGIDGESVSVFGMYLPKNYGIRSFAIFNNTLFVGTTTMLNIPARDSDLSDGIRVGCEIWKMIP